MVQAFDLYTVTGMVTAPNGLSQFLRFYELPGAPACSFDVIACLGAQLPRALAQRAQAHMTPHLSSGYGSTECGQTATAPVGAIRQASGAVGFIAPDLSVEVVDEKGHSVPPGREGHIRVKSPHAVTEYLADRTATAEAFRDGWFYPGDLGSLTSDRMLIIGGRSNSLINLGGDKIKPELVEEVLITFGGVQEAGVFERRDAFGIAELWAAVVSTGAINAAMLKCICDQQLGAAYAPRHFVQVHALPKNEAGKLDRAKLASQPQPAKAGT
jgi:acyl-coenzyme A synthetase/AMP-(fatty) acid ligase